MEKKKIIEYMYTSRDLNPGYTYDQSGDLNH